MSFQCQNSESNPDSNLTEMLPTYFIQRINLSGKVRILKKFFQDIRYVTLISQAIFFESRGKLSLFSLLFFPYHCQKCQKLQHKTLYQHFMKLNYFLQVQFLGTYYYRYLYKYKKNIDILNEFIEGK